MIPKTIHYCWFGGKPKPKLAKKCIKSWKRYCHDYEIIEWNESNFDINSAPLYVKQAYEAKKWAFVTDYVRLWAMTTFGGIYMDTDVEVIAPLDCFLKHKAFSGFEDGINIPTGIMESEKNYGLFKELLNYYYTSSFLKEDGTLDTTNNVQIITKICLSKGLVQNNTFQIIEGFALYPNDYFCPKSYYDGIIRKTQNTHTIHHYAASWLQKDKQKARKAHWKISHKNARRESYRVYASKIVKGIFGDSILNRFKKKIIK